MTDNATVVESRFLAVGKWANLFMAGAGVTAAYLSRSDALLVDGLYSGVNFLSAIVAAKVGAAVTRPPPDGGDRHRAAPVRPGVSSVWTELAAPPHAVGTEFVRPLPGP